MSSKEENLPSQQSLDEFIEALLKRDKSEYSKMIKSLALPINSFDPFISWSSDCYTRNCIVENEKFELILLCWEKGQNTPIHDHGGEECWVKVLEGEFKETIFDIANEELTIKSSKLSKQGDVIYMIDFMGCHRLENCSNGRSMSLHLYAKPIRYCKLFDEDSSKFVRKELVYDTVSELMTNN